MLWSPCPRVCVNNTIFPPVSSALKQFSLFIPLKTNKFVFQATLSQASVPCPGEIENINHEIFVKLLKLHPVVAEPVKLQKCLPEQSIW